ncbi:tRNA uridine-5-carboxymethylaminomethyl(34) synthesis GTPase MnmE [Frigidibacter sp. MR17.14]|uniref:tRNA uridine-5-carboxymethylaminomethyl(34) synthesis GTPase MnmE n=1 Tax=Frigidibacter sp. MR17.14 TaxID=3126509 RepID=UPI003012A990
MDTIYALASARGRAGVAVLRISGPAAFAAVKHLAGAVPEPRRSSLRTLRDGDVVLDQALVLTFARGASFTGEDSAELHLHGSIATVNAVLASLSRIPGLRLAEPGEFTRRALENGCLDLAQVEGLADLIEAETESQRRQALRVLSGAIGVRAEAWRSQLIRAAALIEATIDFADEDVPVDVTPEVLALLDALQAELAREAAGASMSERIRDGFEVAIVGLPNAGKSTLLNALAGREAAITSEVAGTTRDVIEVRMDLDGLAVTLLDTAGLRETEDRVEAIGVQRALDRAAAADLRIFLRSDDGLPMGLDPVDQDIVIRGKADAGGGVSGKTGAGVPELVAQVTAVLAARASGAALVTRERHRLAILTAIEAIESARIAVRGGATRAELAAEDLRRAIRALDSLVGRVDVEHLLGEIFTSFCIGK